MKTEIKPHYVNFNTAKWLKEIGAKLETHYSFTNKSSMWYYIRSISDESKKMLFTYNWFSNFDNMLYAPEQWQVVEWLRVEKGFFIQATFNYKVGRYKIDVMNVFNDSYLCTIDGVNEDKRDYGWNTPQEAYSAAFDYIQTNNLI